MPAPLKRQAEKKKKRAKSVRFMMVFSSVGRKAVHCWRLSDVKAFLYAFFTELCLELGYGVC
jgi:hypothetical protein